MSVVTEETQLYVNQMNQWIQEHIMISHEMTRAIQHHTSLAECNAEQLKLHNKRTMMILTEYNEYLKAHGLHQQVVDIEKLLTPPHIRDKASWLITVRGTGIPHETKILKFVGRDSTLEKRDVYERELAKLQEIFQEVEPSKAKLVEGLIEDAAFLKAENDSLKRLMEKTGMMKIHPLHPDLQKPTEAGKQYLKNVNSYAVIVKTLNGVLGKNMLEGDDPFEDFLRQNREDELP